MSVLALRKGAPMDSPVEGKVPRLKRKLRRTINRLFLKSCSEKTGMSLVDIIAEILLAVENTETLNRLQLLGCNRDEVLSEAFQASFSDKIHVWKDHLLSELEEELEKVARNAAKQTPRKREKIFEKAYKHHEKRMEYAMLFGAEWEDIQEILDSTINDLD